MPIKLPKDPKDHDYEDQSAAVLLAHGYYLETRLVLKSGTEEVMEFDAIATPVNDYENRKVVEIKSGGWGIGDIFKLYGQAQFTGHKGAWLIHKQGMSATKMEAVGDLCGKLPVQTLKMNLHDKETNADIPIGIEMDDKARELVFAIAWWSRIADRVAQARFKSWVKSDTTGAEIIQRARAYPAQLGNSLFKESPLSRADAIYDAYKAAPALTSSLIDHVVAHSGQNLKDVRRSVTDNHGRAHLQYIMALEQRARIAVIKNAYDAVLAEKKETNEEAKKLWSGLGYKAFMPAAFQNGMKVLETHPDANAVPYFLQVFIEVLGGFYFANDPEDVALVAACTGVPVARVPEMVAMLDSFFPIKNGWVFKGGDGLQFIKAVPAFLRGAGCFARENRFGKDWCNKNTSSWWTTRWHNALYGLLKGTLEVEPA